MSELNPIELQKALKGANYPTKKDDLVTLAKKNGAGSEVVDQLSGLSAKEFDGPNDVQKAMFDGK